MQRQLRTCGGIGMVTEEMIAAALESWLPGDKITQAVMRRLGEDMKSAIQAALEVAPVSAPAGQIAAWHTDDGRTISAKQKADAERSGGASASSVAAYSIPSYFGCSPADTRNARRYRWLRQPGRQIHSNTTPSQPWCVRVESDQGLPTVRPIDGTELDAAIDRALGWGEDQ